MARGFPASDTDNLQLVAAPELARLVPVFLSLKEEN